MEKTELLKNARGIMLKLHKSLLDHERAVFEGIHGKMNAGQFLNVLLENEDFAWLRRFSMLIVEIDEMFDIKDGISSELVAAKLEKIRELIEMKEPDEYFRAKYASALQQDVEAAGWQSQLKALLGS